jgi:DNA polymerase elongation subunit (family B)
MKILLLDIETAPNTAHVWGLWQQNVGIPQLLESSYTLCWSAKWYNSKEMYFDSVHQSSTKKMLKGIHKLLNEADAVVHYNGTKFDIPTLNKEFVLNGLAPPAPYKQMDLLKVARSQFRFPSNRLDYVAETLHLGTKTKHEGHTLWIKCMAGDNTAWKEMEQYNKNDVLLLEKVYDRLKPWIKGHANHSVYEAALVCPNCASTQIGKRGFHYTATSKYQRFNCRGCGNWFRSGRSLAGGPDTKGVNV